jgi:serine/threonine protein kinase
MKRCPFCAEEIQDAAVKCKHCGERLPAEDTLDSAHTIPAGDFQAGVPRPALPGRAPSPADTLDSAKTVWADYVRPGKVLAGQYCIIGDGPLGRGGMGEVWLAEDAELGTAVAIKVLPEALARDPAAVENLRREALIGCQLTHANICRLFGLRSDGALKFIVMEYVDGKTLADVLAARPDHRMAWEDLQPVARQVAAALDYAHAASYTDAAGRKVRGVLHRDLKPANIMVTADGAAKLMDFGIAREIHSTMTRLSGRRSLTPLYASPEQFRGEVMSAASDVYSFASVLYECLTGRPLVSPDGDVEYQVLRKPFEPLPGQAEAVNRGLALALSKDAAERPKSADGLVNILAGLMTASGHAISSARPIKATVASGQPIRNDRPHNEALNSAEPLIENHLDDNVHRRTCPAGCGKIFARWPWGADAHAKSQKAPTKCRGIPAHIRDSQERWDWYRRQFLEG